ncbi:MAG TPA: cobalamin-binding protein [Planctomycetaceae bacterium]|nr:cobalamin-binding protein [Planctomycetaceae bacterium]|tara:strand:+ start:855 stop:1781 length:927 start_codon:yes stop_codon:yes gene_type:complete
MTGHRIVSLLPSATEIVAALGGLDQLVGRSHECDHPAGVERLPSCCHPTINIDAPGAEIDRAVKHQLAQAISIFQVDHDLLGRLQPTLILTQDQCEVCAVNLADVESALELTIGVSTQVVSLAPANLADVWKTIETVGQAMGEGDEATMVIHRLESRLLELASAVTPDRASGRPKVACIEWIDPLMVAGNWVPELVELAGGVDVLGTAGRHSPWITWADLAVADADVIVLMPCGFDIERTRSELASVITRSEWQQLRAVSEGQVFITDGHQFFNRPGPRLVESAEILAEILHPGRCDSGHHPDGWQPL